MPEFQDEECVYLQFHGVNASARVILNEEEVGTHDNGYSTFRADVTKVLRTENVLRVEVDNSINERVYPQKADFTFYGGIYRDVELLIVSREHFDLDYYGGPGLQVTTDVQDKKGIVHVKTYTNVKNLAEKKMQVMVKLIDAEGNLVKAAEGCDTILEVENAHLWNGIKDPYLYTLQAGLFREGELIDTIACKCGIRIIHVDPDKGFFLNGKGYVG